ncbi:hypothetical protein JCM10914A_03860 [Paenibacillus sp. JCM 10914]|uniref:DUF294 nucleotidyltransferase-like domain-containing protein n=1 Tax=Paenibacillus sp. JCM 10914 TaxID=1236974 RepID=UPI0003CC4B2F|nr:DUF294 nucleotidyltransferase-like domain-containing protein [Paenibacillus sp. JCM 10914]GAE07936.1 predicted signal-transduction protein containing cAMP-binding and CBS domains [Paenibacillus sp. JCM 10914]
MKPLKSVNPFPLFSEIQKADSAQQLCDERIACQNQLIEMSKNVELREWIASINQMHDLIGQRAAAICEQNMEEAGFGRPPARYAFVAFGSSGRQEATLWSDQDNGLIIGDELEEGQLPYFREFGARLADALELVGYPKCSGKVMCSEPLWSKPLHQWKVQISEWCSDQQWEPVRNFIIASDLRHIAGSRELSESWLQHFRSSVEQYPNIGHAVLRNTVKHKATLNVMGRIVTERFGEHAGGFDVKYGAYIPLVNSIRTMALQRGIIESSTLKRIEKVILLEGGNLLLESVQEAFWTAQRLRNDTPYEIVDGLITSSGYIPQEQLKDKTMQYELRDTLGIVRRIHRSLQREHRFAERRSL